MKHISIILLLLFPIASFCQTTAEVEKRICRTWKPAFYESGGQKSPPSAEQKGNRMSFEYTHGAMVTDGEKITTGTWNYDESRKMITIENSTLGASEKHIGVLLSLTDKELVMEYQSPGKTFLKIFLVPEK
ncbi:MAG: hypothetical protein IT223_03810 [Crocinitomicaceae bacterium]|nr:hypothetical protein [Crocinitomicaceae bacterium]